MARQHTTPMWMRNLQTCGFIPPNKTPPSILRNTTRKKAANMDILTEEPAVGDRVSGGG